MQPAGARALRADDNNETYSEREAVLSAWEQKSLIDEFPPAHPPLPAQL